MLPIPALPPIAEETHRYLLLDGAQCHDPAKRLQWSTAIDRVQPLFDGVLSDRSADVAPYLAQLKAQVNPAHVINRLNEHVTSAGAASFIDTPLAFDTLLMRLNARTNAAFPNKVEYTLRYFDGRVLPHLVAVLNDGQRAAYLGLSRSWWYVTPALAWAAFESEVQTKDTFQPPLQLSSAQRRALIDLCYPNSIIEHFHLTDGELLDRVPPSERYAFFAAALKAAEKYGIDGGPNAVLFCTLALLEGPDFDQKPEWSARLADVAAGRRSLNQVMREAYAY